MASWKSLAVGNMLSAIASWICLQSFSQRPHNISSVYQASNPTDCLEPTISTTLEQVVDCLNTFTVPEGHYDEFTYEAAQPNATERAAWPRIISSFLDVDGNCMSIVLPDTLVDTYTISQFTEPSGASYCVFVELHGEKQFVRGWGTFVVPATRTGVSRHLHLSAPHPLFDGDTPQQAAALFRATGAKSLFIAGRSRLAFKTQSDCVKGSGNTTYYMTDPAHNKLEPFYDAMRSIFMWQMSNGGCPPTSCAFIQFHGKNTSSCSTDQIFLSAGLGTSTSSIDWYTNDVPRPIKRLKAELQHAFPMWNISMPSDSKCGLTATKNVVGRLLNGIEDRLVCTTASQASLATGFFVHVEQAPVVLSPEMYGPWTEALVNAFEETP
ncbi:hypothetical protein LshimejAT787_1602720 [Lyophyllum shimeji]|uniref:Uncharacterized protein n=1 Tax=Lyophyllum shimeji TaxID=47721 RepID=A0A9P3PZZ2_LYOSH|nr:hypothetical protein LshimejAT787_1602720 [Lyophyllum shimeji]